MTTELWKPTKRVCLSIAVLEGAVLDAQAAKDEAKAGRIRALIDERKAHGSEWWIEVKHVGSIEQPFLFDEINAAWSACVMRARAEARKGLRAMGDDALPFVFGDDYAKRDPQPTFGEAVVTLASRSQAYREGLAKVVRERIIHGVVDGEKAYERIHRLGGSQLLLEASAHVIDFNSVGGDLGEG